LERPAVRSLRRSADNERAPHALAGP
jgi:hypothetical protein